MSTQAAQLIAAIRRARSKGLTALELEQLGISQCPWRRLSADEKPERFLRPGERIGRRLGGDGLVRVVIEKVCQ